MSAYESYDETAPAYDRTRRPVGAEIIAGCLTAAPRPLGEIALLDAGCGTGNYAAALVDLVGRVTAVDLSEGMLGRARAKLDAASRTGRVTFRRAAIDALPFPDASFDAVMFNQVLHHLEGGGDPDYGGHARAFAEAHRVLRPGGVVIANVCTHRQLRRGFWYYDLIPEALDDVLKRCAPAARLEAILEYCGFTRRERIVPLDAIMQGEAYFDPRGPLDPAWRGGDSIWALADAEALARAEARLAALDRAGGLADYMAEQDVGRADTGQLTFFVAVKAPVETAHELRSRASSG